RAVRKNRRRSQPSLCRISAAAHHALLPRLIAAKSAAAVFTRARAEFPADLHRLWCVHGPGNDWPLPFAALIISALSLASFFVHYKFWPAVNCFRFPYHPLWHYPWFVAIMFSRFVIGAKGIALATLVGIPIAAIVVVLAAVYFWRVLRHKAGVEAMIQFVLLTYTLLFSVDCAIGRVCLGLPEAAQAARYVSLMIPAFLALYFWLFRLKLGSKRTITLTAFAVISLVASSNRPALLHWYTQTKTTWAACFLQTQNVQACDQLVGISIYPSDGVGAATFQQKLEFLKDHHLSFFAGAAESDRKQ